MSLSQQRGTVSASQGTVQLPQLAPYEYLWLYATAAGAGASAWWSQAPGGRTPNVQLGAGQWRLVDLGAVSAWQLWLAGDLEWITDTDPISEQVSTAGPMTIQTAAGAPVETVFPSAQQVTFGAPQQVTVNAGSVTISGGQGGIATSVNVSGNPTTLFSGALPTVNGATVCDIPAGTDSLMFFVNSPMGAAFTLRGNTTGRVYYSSNTNLGGQPAALDPEDTSIFITINTAGTAWTMDIVGLGLYPPGIGVQQVTGLNFGPVDVSLPATPTATMLFSPTSIANGSQILPAPAAGSAYYITKIQANAASADAAHSGGVCAWIVGVQPNFVSTDYNPPIKTTQALQYNAYTVNQNATIGVYGYIGAA